MGDPAVTFDHVWKKFQLGERHTSIRDLVPAMVGRVLKGKRQTELDGRREFWALKDVSFDVSPGEALGIIGPNGAGKSTTLKLLTKILRPTRGRSVVRGRVGALIEVAAGFHPDLTGRENMYLQGAVMGMRRAEVAARFDEIVEFAGVSSFIDTPVKRYSSGMNARLGFSIAAHLEPHVLIIDEVLSVGDAAFQQRCVNRMFEFRERGTTIVFVSHDLQAISTLCHRVLYLRKDVPVLGPTAEVVGQYVRDAAGRSAADPASPIHICEAELVDKDGRHVTSVAAGRELVLRVTCDVRAPLSDLVVGMTLFRSTDSMCVYQADMSEGELGFAADTIGRHRFDFRFQANVTRGHYHVDAYVYHVQSDESLSRLTPAAMFVVEEDVSRRGIADIAFRASAEVVGRS